MLVACTTCGTETRLSDLLGGDTCPDCRTEIPPDAPTKVPTDIVDDVGWDKVRDKDDAPIYGVDFQQDEVTEPDRDVEAITDVLTDVEPGDRLKFTIGPAEGPVTATMAVLTHEEDVEGFDHRLNLVMQPREDGWTRIYITTIGKSGFDPWEVASAPYLLNGDKTLDMRDFAANGWVVDAEPTEDDLTPVDGGDGA